MTKDDKIEVMVDYWIDDSDMQTICEYAATKLTENYNLLSIEKSRRLMTTMRSFLMKINNCEANDEDLERVVDEV